MQEQPTTPVPAPSLARERLQLGSVLLAVVFIFLLTSVLREIVDGLLSVLAPAVTETDFYPSMLSGISMYLVAMPASRLFFLLGESTPPERREKLSLPVLLGLIAICFALTYIGNFLGAIVNAVIGVLTGELPENELNTMTSSAPLWANLLLVGILAPIMEEIFLRKLVIDRLRRYGDLFALLVSGLLFGAVHGNFYQLFYATAMGLLFGYVYLRTGRLRYTVILHLAINLVGGVYASEMLKRIDLEALAATPYTAIMEDPVGVLLLLGYFAFIVLCVLGAAVAAVLLGIFWVRKYRPAPAARRLSPAEWRRVLLLNPALWILLVFFVLLYL